MSRIIGIRTLFFIVSVLISATLYGQFKEGAGDRANIKWRQLKGDTYKVIYPQGADSLAIKYLWLLEQNKKATMLGLGLDKPANVPVILHNRTANSNGMVTWTPKRMELYTLPSLDTYSHIWEEQLAIHEARHVGQITHFTKGIFKIAQYVIGEQSPGLGVGLYGGQWNLEGDAVVAETELTNAGRGRSADFLEYHRLSVLEGDFRRPQDWKFGSYKNYSASLYEFGYMINSSIRYQFGDYRIAGKILDKTVKKFYTPVVKKIVYKNYIGRTYQEQFTQAQKLMDSIWREDLKLRGSFTKAEPLVNKTTDYYVKYASPVVLSADSIIYVKSSYENSTELVLVSNGKERVLRPFSGYISKLTQKGNKIYFTEHVKDKRWDADVYSNLYCMNLDNYGISAVTKNSWYYYPQVSPKTDNILLIEYLNNGGSRLVVLDPNKSKKSAPAVVSIIEAPYKSQITSHTWSGENIYITVLSGAGLGLYSAKYNFESNAIDGEWKEIIKPQTSKISDLMDGGDFVYFLSDMDGVNNIYKLCNNGIERITNDKYGAHYPYIYNNYIYYTAAGSQGYYPVRAKVGCNAEFNSKRDVVLKDGELENLYVYPVAEELTRQAKDALAQEGLLRGNDDKSNGESASIVSFTKTIDEFAKEIENKKYSKIGHLFKFHSWAPFYYDVDKLMAFDFNHIDEALAVGATLYSQNTLGNAVSKLGYSYSKGRHAGHFNFAYTGLYPVFEIKADINAKGQSAYVYSNGKVATYKTSNADVVLNLSAYIPFTFNSHGLYRGITPQILWQFTNNFITDSLHSSKVYNQELRYGVQGYIVRPVAHSAIYPKWGVGVYIGGSTAPNGGEYIGSAAALYTYGYVPGIFPKHGIKLTLGYQRQWANVFYLNNIISQPRGFDDILYADKYMTATLDYAMPIYVGNLHIPKILFVKRFQLNPFVDFANTAFNYKSSELNYQHCSFGATFMVDCHILGFGKAISAGVRYARNYTTQKNLTGFKNNSVKFVASVAF